MMPGLRPVKIVEPDDVAEERLRSRCQRYCRGLLIAASVALQQIGPDASSSMRENPPYVQLLEGPPERFSPKEFVGHSILTTDFTFPADADRRTGNPN